MLYLADQNKLVREISNNMRLSITFLFAGLALTTTGTSWDDQMARTEANIKQHWNSSSRPKIYVST